MERALIYELIVRRANGNGGRNCTAGADADIFRTMDRDWSKRFDGNYVSSEYERGLSLGIVTAYLKDSVERLIKSGEYTEGAVKELESCSDALLHPTIDVIDATVNKIANVLKPL